MSINDGIVRVRRRRKVDSINVTSCNRGGGRRASTLAWAGWSYGPDSVQDKIDGERETGWASLGWVEKSPWALFVSVLISPFSFSVLKYLN